MRQDRAPPRPKGNIDFNNTDNMDTPGPQTLAGQSIYQQTLERMNDSSIFERKGRASQTLTDLLLMIMGSIRTVPLPLMLLFHELEDWDGRDLM